jgi:DNA-directed RNA polymerase subunit M/transcription elongation factor TFIIS
VNIDNNKTREVTIWYLNNRLILKKSHCTLKNITEALITILKKDNLPRCPKCGSRPHYYHEYEYGSLEIGTNNSSLPMWNAFLAFIHPERNTEVSTYVIAECCCGNQWKLKDFCSVYDIYDAYKEGNV